MEGSLHPSSPLASGLRWHLWDAGLLVLLCAWFSATLAPGSSAGWELSWPRLGVAGGTLQGMGSVQVAFQGLNISFN